MKYLLFIVKQQTITMGRSFKLHKKSNISVKKEEEEKVWKESPYNIGKKKYTFGKVYFGFYEGEYANPPKVEFLPKPNPIWDD